MRTTTHTIALTRLAILSVVAIGCGGALDDASSGGQAPGAPTIEPPATTPTETAAPVTEAESLPTVPASVPGEPSFGWGTVPEGFTALSLARSPDAPNLDAIKQRADLSYRPTLVPGLDSTPDIFAPVETEGTAQVLVMYYPSSSYGWFGGLDPQGRVVCAR